MSSNFLYGIAFECVVDTHILVFQFPCARVLIIGNSDIQRWWFTFSTRGVAPLFRLKCTLMDT